MMSMNFKSIQSMPGKHKGFTLLEALVAFLILSIGTLGVASLQLISLKAGHTAAVRTVVVTKVEDMFERIRNNPGRVLRYDDAATGYVEPANGLCNDYDGVITTCESANPGDAIVLHDKFQWKEELEDILSDGMALTPAIVVDGAPVTATNPIYKVYITIDWVERDPETQGTINRTYSAAADICGNTQC